jgi:quinolinate synthase
MSSYAASSPRTEFVIGTEEGMLYRLRQDNPGKIFHPLLSGAMICPNMKKTTLRGVYECLRDLKHNVDVEKGVADRARAAIMKMLEYRG